MSLFSTLPQRPHIDFVTEGLLLAHRVGRNCGIRVEWVNGAQTEAEIEALRKCVNRGTPYGTETWKTEIAATLGLNCTLQPRGSSSRPLFLPF